MRRVTRRGWFTLALLLTGACSDRVPRPAADSLHPRDVVRTVHVDLTGAGATFPYPLYARWFNDFALISNTRINYESVGSGNGVAQLLARRSEFAATDVPLTDDEIQRAGGRVVHVPTVVGAVAVTYNLPRLGKPLRISAEVMADIFLGRITRWNDPQLAALNREVTLPDTSITVVHRSDASGTSSIVSDFLSRASQAWATGPGRQGGAAWPVGVGGVGNEGVAGAIKQTTGAIGYLEVVYARQNRLPTAHVRNPAGRFVSPMPFEVATAAASAFEQLAPSAQESTRDLRLSLLNAPGANAYPIASFTWLVFLPDVIGPERSAQIIDFVSWALQEGTETATQLGYVPLPTAVADRVLVQLRAIGRTSNR